MGDEDREYLVRVRTLRCCAWPAGGCVGPIQAHHAGRRPGVAMKAHDHTAIPLCLAHHGQWHAASGPFKNWRRADRERWSDEMIAATLRTLRMKPATELEW